MTVIPVLIRRLVALASLIAAPASAAETQVAVAANFSEPAREIAAGFEKATGHKAVLSFGASGAFFTQIAQGAPFEVLLSADAERPIQAEKAGLAVPGTRFTYAIGRLVLYSATPSLVAGGSVLKTRQFDKIAIADPTTAPYGAAAIETMRKLGVYQAVGSRIVTSKSIGQAYLFTSTGAAELGFVALSQVIHVPGGSRWIVPARLHTPIDQQAVLLRTGSKNPAARAFVKYLKSRAAQTIIRRFGYIAR